MQADKHVAYLFLLLGCWLGLMGCQIRNTATPAGNIVPASPISDLNAVLLAS